MNKILLTMLMLVAIPAGVQAANLYDGSLSYDNRDRASNRLYYDELFPTSQEPEPEPREPDRLRLYGRSQSLEDLIGGPQVLGGPQRLEDLFGGPQVLEGRAGFPRRGGL